MDECKPLIAGGGGARIVAALVVEAGRKKSEYRKVGWCVLEPVLQTKRLVAALDSNKRSTAFKLL